MKLGTRLGLAFLAMVLLTLGVGGLSLTLVSRMNAKSVDVSDNYRRRA